jgi:hypothetical protein
MFFNGVGRALKQAKKNLFPKENEHALCFRAALFVSSPRPSGCGLSTAIAHAEFCKTKKPLV